jgi:uncharacterized protein (DUF1015 family)
MQIKPFKAYRFNPAVVGDDSTCYAPPYDVIDDAQRQQLYDKSRYNIVRITKGKTTPDDNAHNNQYTRAADFLAEWLKKGVLKQDQDETIYAYVQDFPDPRDEGLMLQRASFIALAKLEEFGPVVKPHEQVLSAPLADRLNLKKAIQAEAGLVFMLYDDQQNVAETIIKLKTQNPKLKIVDFTDDQEVRHRLYAITDSSETNQIVQMIREKSCIIADGHHRYTTGLNYFKQSNNPAAGYQMMAFSNICQNGLIVLATHRLVGNLVGFNFENFLAGLEKKFKITKLPFDNLEQKNLTKKKMLVLMHSEFENNKNAFGIYGANNAFYVAVLKILKTRNSKFKTQEIDVSVLHKQILEQFLGIDEKAAAKGENIKYIKGIHDAVDESIAEVDSGRRQVAFFLNPVKIEQLTMVTDAGQRMPQKSTFFYPKLFSGLTIQKI